MSHDWIAGVHQMVCMVFPVEPGIQIPLVHSGLHRITLSLHIGAEEKTRTPAGTTFHQTMNGYYINQK